MASIDGEGRGKPDDTPRFMDDREADALERRAIAGAAILRDFHSWRGHFVDDPNYGFSALYLANGLSAAIALWNNTYDIPIATIWAVRLNLCLQYHGRDISENVDFLGKEKLEDIAKSLHEMLSSHVLGLEDESGQLIEVIQKVMLLVDIIPLEYRGISAGE